MKYIKGNPKSPSGSLIAFSEVKGHNPIEPNAKILAVHVVISPLSAHSYNYPVVVFPVSAFTDKKHFFKIVDFIGNCDVIQLEDFQLPDDKDEEEYIKERMKMLNEIVQEYVDAFQRKYANSVQEQDLAIFDYLLDFEQLTIPPTSHSKIKKKKVIDIPMDLKKSLEGIESLLYKSENKKTSTTKTTKTKSKKNTITKKTETRGRKKKIKIEEFKPYIAFIRKYHPEIDIDNFEKAIQKNDFELANLYLQKFFAISDERYETAQYFQNRINQRKEEI